MKFYIALAILLVSGAVFASNPWCAISFSAGSASDVPADSGFLPAEGAALNSGVKYTIRGYNIGGVAWGNSGTKTIFVPSCFYLASGPVIYVQASYVGRVGGPPLRSFCYNEKLSTLFATNFVIPEFPGPLWKPC